MPKIQYDENGYPLYDQNAGWKNHSEFEAAALNDMARIQAIGKKQISVNTPQGSVKALQDPPQLGKAAESPFPIGSVVPAVGGVLGSGLDEFIGPAGTLGGTALGSMAKQALQEKFPGIFGQPPQTTLGRIADVGLDTALQGVPATIASNGLSIPLKGAAGKIAKNLLGSSTINLLSKQSPKIVDAIHALSLMGKALTLDKPPNDSSQK